MSVAALWRAACVAALVFSMGASAQGAERCLGPEATEVLQERFEASAKGLSEIDSMMVQKDTVELTILFEGDTYAFAGHGTGESGMVFTPVGDTPPPVLTTLMAQFTGSLPTTIWSNCAGPDEQHPPRSSHAAVHDLSHLPEAACRPVPGHYCFDEFWTLPPRWTITGALVAYWLYVLVFVVLLGLGAVWVVRTNTMRDNNAATGSPDH